ncbi:hypothetical protein BJ508DRAFT_350570 [Ascobolus immersus RN42]|uniref:Uncharacterized protein n=1 Tax=Ascobolus immersus RN42 TaxID=1160509 RepID=A0A3N4HXZ3_ASCIM|nr:hypothetical protein BJ508DRAFT_350570 [Ascobolus immersus RN42]
MHHLAAYLDEASIRQCSRISLRFYIIARRSLPKDIVVNYFTVRPHKSGIEVQHIVSAASKYPGSHDMVIDNARVRMVVFVFRRSAFPKDESDDIDSPDCNPSSDVKSQSQLLGKTTRYPHLEKVTLDFSEVSDHNWTEELFGKGWGRHSLNWAVVAPLLAECRNEGRGDILFRMMGGVKSGYEFVVQSRVQAIELEGTLNVPGFVHCRHTWDAAWEKATCDAPGLAECLSVIYRPNKTARLSTLLPSFHTETYAIKQPYWTHKSCLELVLASLFPKIPLTISPLGMMCNIRNYGFTRLSVSEPTALHLPISLAGCMKYLSSPGFKLTNLHLEGVQILDNQLLSRGFQATRGFAGMLVCQSRHLVSLVLRNVKLECSVVARQHTTLDDQHDKETVGVARHNGFRIKRDWRSYRWEDVLDELQRVVWERLRVCELEELRDSAPYAFQPTFVDRCVLRRVEGALLCRTAGCSGEGSGEGSSRAAAE